jgi:hypothetical protein
LLIIPFAHKDAYLSRYAAPDKGWTDRDEARWPMPYWYIDTGMAALLMLQTVVDEGLGACFFGLSPSRVSPVTAEFGVPDGYEPIGVLSIGYRAPDTPSPPPPPPPPPRSPKSGVARPPHYGAVLLLRPAAHSTTAPKCTRARSVGRAACTVVTWYKARRKWRWWTLPGGRAATAGPAIRR